MNQLNGWIKLHRGITDWGWYSDPNTKAVFLHLLLTANLEDKEYLGHKIPAGSTVIGLNSLSNKLGMSVQQVRTALEKLQRTGEISKKATNKFSVVTIEKWSFYQGDDRESNKQITNEQQSNNNPITNEQQTDNKRITTPKEYKNIRIKEYKNKEDIEKDNNNNNYNKRPYGTYTNVYLTDEEFDRFIKAYPNWKDKIDYLSAYMKDTGKNYKSHYATLTKWAKEDEQKNESQRDNSNEKGTQAAERKTKDDWGEYAGWFAKTTES